MTQITIAYGDGIGHEIMDAALLVMREAGAQLDVEVLQIGEEEYRLGAANGFDNRTLRSIQRAVVLLKAPTINPELIAELEEERAQQNFMPASEALCAALELDKRETTFIYADKPELAAISNIGEKFAMFENAQDYAPKNIDKDIANPAGMILAATHMLVYIQQNEVAVRIGNALAATLEAGIHTQDIFDEGKSKKLVGTNEFAENVIKNMVF